MLLMDALWLVSDFADWELSSGSVLLGPGAGAHR